MRKLKIYLETTLFNFYFDKDREAHAATVRLFEDIAVGKFEAYTSTYVTDELESAPKTKRDNMLKLITKYDIKVLPPINEADKLADIYIAEGIIPPKYRTDGVHIAVATVYELDFIVSMNFQHIVKLKTTLMTRTVNIMNGYRPVEINSPMEVVENENA